MKPKSKKGLESDSIKTLSTSMKPSKRRSAESQVKKSPVSVQMLNVLDGNKGRDSQAETSLQSRGRIRRQKAVVRLTDAADNSQDIGGDVSSFLSSENRSTLSSLANSTSSFQEPLVASGRSGLRSGLRSAARKQISSLGCSTPVTPRILVSKCEKLEKLVEEKEVKTKKILRGKIKSPANKINKSIAERNLRNKERIESYETQLKKKESEILSLTRKVNLLQKTVSEREKTIKGLEIKFPKMISELKHGLLEEKKTNVELKDVLKKFRQANGNKKQVEEKLKQKDEKLKEIKLSKKKLTMELQSKESELSDFRIRIRSLEGKIPQLVDEIESKEDELRQQVAEISERDEDLARSEETVEFLEQRLAAQSEEQKNQEKLIDDLKRKLNEYTDELDAKEIEIQDLRASNVELYNELQEQYEVLEKTDQETQNYLQIIEGIREKIDSAPMEKIHNSIEYLDKATDDFLEKVSSVSKRKNISFGVKLTVRKGSVPAGQNQLERLESFVLNPSSFNNNSTRFSFNNVKHSSINSGRFSQDFRLSQSRNSSIHHPSRGSLDEPRRNLQFKFMNSTTDSFDDVFQDERGRRVSTAESSRITETSRSDVDISSDTCTRLEVLDDQVRSLWNRLSAKDSSYEVFKCDTEPQFSSSVGKLKEDLSVSVEQQNRFLNQVKVAKRLFESPKSSGKKN